MVGFAKSTYMYWQKRFDRESPDKELEEKVKKSHEEHKDYGYRRMTAYLCAQGLHVNKKRIQRIMRKLNLQVTSFTRKSRKYSSYRGNVGKISPNRVNRRFYTNIAHQKITTDTSEFKYYEVDEKGKMNIKKLYLDADGKKELNVLKMRVAGRMLIMKAEGIDSIEQAEAYRNKRIYLNRDDVNIGDGHFIEDLLGCEVFDIDSGEKIGEISDVSKTGANDVWHIKSDDKTYLIPVIDSVVINVDVDNGKIEIRPLEGLFDI